MSRVLLRSLIACGLSAVVLAGGWFAAVGLTLGVPSRSAPAAALPNVDLVACPTQPTYHDAAAHCIYLDTTKPLFHFPGPEAASRFGKPCEHCLRELSRQSSAVARAARP